MAVLIFIVILSLLVFVHEAGHFSIAKWAGMKVEEFGFGFPPRLFGVRRGETEYSVNLIPLGGFVKIFGESGEHQDDPRSFASRSKWKRFLVLIAGVAMNVLLAWVLLMGGFAVGLPTAVDEPLPGQPHITDSSVQITYVLPDSSAADAGVELGDRVLAVNGTSVLDAARARELIGTVAEGETLELTVERDGVSRTLEMSPRQIENGQIAIGTQITTVGIVRYGFFDAVIQGTN
ncbi:MAG: site-2 protease family protein, partial [Patescibacteria group bacterium]